MAAQAIGGLVIVGVAISAMFIATGIHYTSLRANRSQSI
jgi:hypothetical protein